MRSWFVDGYIPPSTPVAPSYYGEFPAQFWTVVELWADPASQAFVLDSDAAPAPEAPSALPEYIACEAFEGRKEGYVFKHDDYGLGYYRDEPPAIEVCVSSRCRPSPHPLPPPTFG